MASNGGEEDPLKLWSDVEFPSLDQLLLAEGFPMAESSNDGADHSDVSGVQSNNAHAPGQQSAQTAVVTSQEQGDPSGTLESLTTLNLKADKTIYMLKKTEAILRGGQGDRRTREALGSQKFKATCVPFSVLRIGTYEVRPRYPGHLTAKWYYTKKRLNWEMIENGLKKKIEINWADISAIRIQFGEDVEILEIEMDKPPSFYHETELRPKKHTSWKSTSDFTDGQASSYRRHHLEFPRDSLEKNMEPLFFLDSRLRELTTRPFPSCGSPFFEGYLADAPQSAPPVTNSELKRLHHHLHHQPPPNHSSVSACLADDNLMTLIQEYQRRPVHHQKQKPSLEYSSASHVSDYGYAPPPSFPVNGTIFNRQFMGHLPGEQIAVPSSYDSGNVAGGTGHGYQGYDHNGNPPNMMMASQNPLYPSAVMNAAYHPHQWNHHESIFNQRMGHHPVLASSSNGPAMGMSTSSRYYPTADNHAGQGTYENYNGNNGPCRNDNNGHHAHAHGHAHAHDGVIYPEFMFNHDPNHQDPFNNVDYNGNNGPRRNDINAHHAHALGHAHDGVIYPEFVFNHDPTHQDPCNNNNYNGNDGPWRNDVNAHHAHAPGHAHDGVIYPEFVFNHDPTHQDPCNSENYNGNNGPCRNDVNAHHAHAPGHARDGVIYPEFVFNHDPNNQDPCNNENYNGNNDPCRNNIDAHHAHSHGHAHDGVIYPEYVSNQDPNHQHSQFPSKRART